MKTKISIVLSGLLLAACIAKAQQPQPQGGGGRPPGPPPSPAEHSKRVTERLEKDLTLSKEQAEKVSTAYQAFFTGMDKVRGEMPPPPPPPPMPPAQKKKADSLSVIRDEAIRKALTADQFAKYKEIEKTMRPPRPQGPPRQQGTPPQQPAPKQ